MSDLRNPGDAWVTAADGGRYWGRFGAAGLLAYDRSRDAILLQHRITWSDHGDTWGIPGGAINEHEYAVDAAIREAQEEAGVPDNAVTPRYTHVLDRGGWKYTTLIAEVTTPFEPEITDSESHALAWVKLDEVEQYPLHPAFAASWPVLRPLLSATPTVIVDAANVIGSVPNGWWKDRRAANERLRDRIDVLARSGRGIRSGFLDLPETVIPGLETVYPDWILVVEGAARGIPDGQSVSVVSASELGDDEIVAQVERLAGSVSGSGSGSGSRSLITVVTSDVELKTRSIAAGASATRGVSVLLHLIPERAETAADSGQIDASTGQ